MQSIIFNNFHSERNLRDGLKVQQTMVNYHLKICGADAEHELVSWVDLPSGGQKYVSQEGFLTQRFNVGEENIVVIIPLETEILPRHCSLIYFKRVYSHF